MSGSPDSPLKSCVTGLAIGVILGAVGCVFLLIAKTTDLAAGAQPLATTPHSTPSASPSQSHLPSPPATPLAPTATPSPAQALFTNAEEHLQEGDGTTAIELLQPLLDQLSSAEDLSRLNEDLARAEFLIGHFQRAAGYFEAAFALAPRPETLLEMANCYDLGGDLHTALARYLRLAAWDGAPEDLRQISRERAREIVAVLGTPTPGN